MKILLVDDDSRVLAALRRMVAQLGHDADCADNAEDAALLVRTRHYDFVLIDFQMPGHNGMWFLEHARIPEDTKVLVMSGFTPLSEVRSLMEKGAAGYVSKPFGVSELTRLLAGEILPLRRMAARLDHILDPHGDARTGRTLVCMKEVVPAT